MGLWKWWCLKIDGPVFFFTFKRTNSTSRSEINPNQVKKSAQRNLLTLYLRGVIKHLFVDFVADAGRDFAEPIRDKEWDSIAAVHRGRAAVTTWSFHRSTMGQHRLVHERFRTDLQLQKASATVRHPPHLCAHPNQ